MGKQGGWGGGGLSCESSSSERYAWTSAFSNACCPWPGGRVPECQLYLPLDLVALQLVMYLVTRAKRLPGCMESEGVWKYGRQHYNVLPEAHVFQETPLRKSYRRLSVHLPAEIQAVVSAHAGGESGKSVAKLLLNEVYIFTR